MRTLTEDDVMLAFEGRSRQRIEAVKALLREEGRPDLADELDAKLRDIRLGLDSARSAWHSISPAQRRALELLGEASALARAGCGYVTTGRPDGYAIKAGRLATMRALCAHELIACDGTVTDPECRFVLTERGRFVLKHGRAALQGEGSET